MPNRRFSLYQLMWSSWFHYQYQSRGCSTNSDGESCNSPCLEYQPRLWWVNYLKVESLDWLGSP